MKKSFRYKNYIIEEWDQRNVRLYVMEGDHYHENDFKPDGMQTGDMYLRKVDLGFWQKPEQLGMKILDDLIWKRMLDDCQDLHDLITACRLNRLSLINFFSANQPEMDPIWP